jgi:DNA-3-methyladenine glycosylase I
MQEHRNWQMPEWWCRKQKPPNDKVYFENMCRVIFQADLNWRVIDGKWPTTKKAFSNFNFKNVAAFSDHDVERLL